ncbi:MAG: HAMP domain-containing protein [Calditrichaeota bacterium]|nr:HAMP domain-containing protein [Calditrichota bacterium]
MNIKLPISLRLTLWYSALLLLGLGLFGFIAFFFVGKELYDEQFNTLSESAEEISEFVTLRNDSLDVRRLVEETNAMNLQENGIFFEIWADSSDFIYRSRNFPRFLKTSYTTLEQSPTRIPDRSGQLYHLYSSSVTLAAANEMKNHIFHIRTGQSVLYVQRVLNRIRMLLLLMIPVLLLLAGLSGWLLARRSLKPVVDITNAAREISLYQLDKKLPEPEQNDELRQLVQTFNAMIGRIQTGVTKIQQFTADASHELRTPLTVLRGEMEVTLRKPREKHEYISALHRQQPERNLLDGKNCL